jgi:hypothetical protein
VRARGGEAGARWERAGFGWRAESEAGASLRRKNSFSFYFSINSPKTFILSTKNPFSQVGTKIEVVYNFKLYNFA